MMGKRYASAASWWAWFSGRAKNTDMYILPFPLYQILPIYSAVATQIYINNNIYQ